MRTRVPITKRGGPKIEGPQPGFKKGPNRVPPKPLGSAEYISPKKEFKNPGIGTVPQKGKKNGDPWEWKIKAQGNWNENPGKGKTRVKPPWGKKGPFPKEIV